MIRAKTSADLGHLCFYCCSSDAIVLLTRHTRCSCELVEVEEGFVERLAVGVSHVVLDGVHSGCASFVALPIVDGVALAFDGT